jgi:hypothetical protein
VFELADVADCEKTKQKQTKRIFHQRVQNQSTGARATRHFALRCKWVNYGPVDNEE